jgi:L-amino acid N-acyltransferase YncA
VVGVAESIRLRGSNVAEVAFSVSAELQGKGLGKLFLRKLAEAARENGLSGLMAFTSPGNQGMIHLFQTLPYKVHKKLEDGDLVLNCQFDELA